MTYLALTNVKRTFLIYPRGGDKDYTYTSYVSLYARIDDSNIIDSQVVYAEIKFFVYNYIHKAYYYYQGRYEILDDPLYI